MHLSQLAEQKYRHQIASRLLQQHDKKYAHDLTIICSGTSFPVHRIILATCSIYFYQMFERNSRDLPFKRLGLPDYNARVMTILIDYMYTGILDKSHLSISDIQQLHKALQMFHMYDLQCYRSNLMCASLNLNNCFEIWKLAFELNTMPMIKRVESFVVQNFRTCVKHEEFVHVSLKQLLRILNHDEHSCRTDVLKSEAAFTWFKAYPKERAKYWFVIASVTKVFLSPRQKVDPFDETVSMGSAMFMLCKEYIDPIYVMPTAEPNEGNSSHVIFVPVNHPNLLSDTQKELESKQHAMVLKDPSGHLFKLNKIFKNYDCDRVDAKMSPRSFRQFRDQSKQAKKKELKISESRSQGTFIQDATSSAPTCILTNRNKFLYSSSDETLYK